MASKRVKQNFPKIIGRAIDWWIMEDLDSADFFDIKGEAEQDKDKRLLDKSFYVHTLLCPARRYEDLEVEILLDKQVTFREVMQILYDLYKSEIKDEHKLDEDEKEEEDFYQERDSEIKTYLDLLTRLPDQGRGSTDKDTNGKDRHPFMCSGRVRFEGLTLIDPKKGDYVVDLGT